MEYKTIKEWYAEYERICVVNNVPWLATGDSEDYRDSFDEGDYSPQDHFYEDCCIAAQE